MLFQTLSIIIVQVDYSIIYLLNINKNIILTNLFHCFTFSQPTNLLYSVPMRDRHHCKKIGITARKQHWVRYCHIARCMTTAFAQDSRYCGNLYPRRATRPLPCSKNIVKRRNDVVGIRQVAALWCCCACDVVLKEEMTSWEYMAMQSIGSRFECVRWCCYNYSQCNLILDSAIVLPYSRWNLVEWWWWL